MPFSLTRLLNNNYYDKTYWDWNTTGMIIPKARLTVRMDNSGLDLLSLCQSWGYLEVKGKMIWGKVEKW